MGTVPIPDVTHIYAKLLSVTSLLPKLPKKVAITELTHKYCSLLHLPFFPLNVGKQIVRFPHILINMKIYWFNPVSAFCTWIVLAEVPLCPFDLLFCTGCGITRGNGSHLCHTIVHSSLYCCYANGSLLWIYRYQGKTCFGRKEMCLGNGFAFALHHSLSTKPNHFPVNKLSDCSTALTFCNQRQWHFDGPKYVPAESRIENCHLVNARLAAKAATERRKWRRRREGRPSKPTIQKNIPSTDVAYRENEKNISFCTAGWALENAGLESPSLPSSLA